MSSFRKLILLCFVLVIAACSTTPIEPVPSADLGHLWVKNAAEYSALTLQAYGAAHRALQGYIDDTAWSALPGQKNFENLPPAIIFDVDETLVSNVDFQLAFVPPFANWKLDKWNREHEATPIAGATDFVDAASRAGVTLFFVTNRPCERIEDDPRTCPQELTTLEDLREVGIQADAEHLMLSREQADWSREKLVRRELIAQTHRVIMLIGDDLGDFIPCVRAKPYSPCTESATSESRDALVRRYRDYWGSGWYILPNPMHGSWTSSAE